jgi:predicted DNA-binding transcriptional regulator YafY
MTRPANRLLTLILLLQRQPNQKASELANSLGVSIRTLHRYIGLLDEMGIPVYTGRGRHGGFSLVRGYKMPPLVFTPEEATAVSLGAGLVGEMWGDLYREAARAALAKLENLLPEQQREEVEWARRSLVTAGLVHPGLEAQAAVLEKLRHAIRNTHRVEMTYISTSSAVKSTRKLDPYALAFRWGWWYVVGYCYLRKEVRTFRIDRIQELTILREYFEAPIDFEAHEFISRNPQGQEPVKARIRFSKEAAAIARLNPLTWETAKEEPDGSIIVTTSAPDMNWAASTFLAYGPIIEVLDPPELRNLMLDWAEKIVREYSQKGD